MATHSLYHEVGAQYKATLDDNIIEFHTPHEAIVTVSYINSCRSSMPLEPSLHVQIKN
jgi:hypothetical protein